MDKSENPLCLDLTGIVRIHLPPTTRHTDTRYWCKQRHSFTTTTWISNVLEKDTKIISRFFYKMKMLCWFGWFILAAAAPLLLFFFFLSQSFAFLFVPSRTPMRSLALLVAILHRAAALAFPKGVPTRLWFVARRTTNGGMRRRCCCCGCSICYWFTFIFVQSLKIFNSAIVSFVCCFGPPFTC